MLGHEVADSTVAKYMVKMRRPDPSQRWGTFIRNHMDVTAACDFFVVPTATFPFGRRHLLRTLRDYVEYYKVSRPHQSLDRNAPTPREVEAVGEVCAAPVLGGLHHRYFRAA